MTTAKRATPAKKTAAKKTAAPATKAAAPGSTSAKKGASRSPSVDYSGCIDLMCRMQNDEATYAAFQNAMTTGGATFSDWLSANGVPAAIAKQIANSTPPDLYTVAGEVVCKRFW